MTASQSFDTPIGGMTVFADDKSVKEIIFGGCDREKPNEVTNETVKQLREYFAGERKEFSVPLDPDGTEFQKKVWKALLDVPYGEVSSYKDIAEKIGNCRAYRAVGGANGKNPIVIIIPCHRIIASDGSAGGYSCGIDKKLFLLDFEKNCTGERR